MSKYFDIELEQSILLACIENNENIDIAASIIKPSDFSYRLHADIFEFILNKRRLRESVDLKLVKISFASAKDSFWTALEQQNSFIEVDEYSKMLRNLSVKDQLNSLMNTSTQELSSVQDSIDYTHNLNAKIYSLVSGVSDNTLKSSRTAVNEFYEELNRVSKIIDKDVIGVDTGFSLLNHYTKGFKAGELIILAARPGMGKTTFALNILLNALKKDVGVVFYSLETEAYKIMAKLIAQDTGIGLQNILTGDRLTEDEINNMQMSANMLSEKTLYIYDKGNLNIEFLRSSLRRLKEEHNNIGLCVLDYIQLMNSLNTRADRHIQVSEISRGLKLLALELKIPILALSQVNRSVDSRMNKKLMLSDIRESGSIEQDADLILFINKADDDPTILAERHAILDIAKNRSGELKEIHFDFKASKAKFLQLEFRKDNEPSETEEF
ncbi:MULTISPECIES: DnaB-like helicase C-terminal domain-containing protein [unclassified Campylobacter]|uniref:DnaB-like helicase C-terminal domain-containing protein n=1 Tax=unclassified Campylobacter TaxID=2593542 RepID=UPI001BD971C8|nr:MULTISPECIES: DnaB-like helicase C-terminal domain-containing protein [unclassified Campylobacter]MBZ7976526.1 AAA family ATPase [Campylobacter sp. RM12637]MBZ7978116.1 AAA family ATPase [Campylobacter sp. RM12654]MBZ7981409.1 AAA family ATPase [Campylobacter sp. RM12640]MBZ7983815.1 AAA family ATPase [Campylobacter sp. RM12647]MBZ7988995.1 AAA family ATPase [Campylobacter sp. RM12635]MBZ7993494.1 AAA family ATPase [Campylobacter sp. RM9333]MBZ8007774.1 AAA family ATPase [Campylobacter sp